MEDPAEKEGFGEGNFQPPQCPTLLNIGLHLCPRFLSSKATPPTPHIKQGPITLPLTITYHHLQCFSLGAIYSPGRATTSPPGPPTSSLRAEPPSHPHRAGIFAQGAASSPRGVRAETGPLNRSRRQTVSALKTSCAMGESLPTYGLEAKGETGRKRELT